VFWVEAAFFSGEELLVGAGISHNGQALSFLEGEFVSDEFECAFFGVAFSEQEGEIVDSGYQRVDLFWCEELSVFWIWASMCSFVGHVRVPVQG